MFEIYKQTQGKYTRVITFVSGMVLATIGAIWLSNKLEVLQGQWKVYLQYGLSAALWVGSAGLLFFVVNKPKMADFMIATEGEMKKVSWSSRKEIIGSTKVVIFATLALAVLLYVVDMIFQTFFVSIDVLRLSGK
jgi:preprotein translocase subunit SecE